MTTWQCRMNRRHWETQNIWNVWDCTGHKTSCVLGKSVAPLYVWERFACQLDGSLPCVWLGWGSEETGWKAKALRREPLLMLFRDIAKAEREQKSRCELSTGKEQLGLWAKKTFAVRFLLCLLPVSGTGGDGIYLTVLVLHLVFGTATFWMLQVEYCAGFLSS